MSTATFHLDPLLGAIIAAPIRDLTAVLVASLAAGALLLRAPAARWTAAISALLVAPLLLAGVVLDADRIDRLSGSGALLAAGLLAGLAVLAATTALLIRRPLLLAPLLAVALPLRLPISIGGESVNLLLPLYGLIGAGTLAAAWRAWSEGRERAQAWDLRTGPPPKETLRAAWTGRSLQGAAALVPILLAGMVLLYGLRIPFGTDPDRGVQTLCFFLLPFSLLFVLLRNLPWEAQTLRRTAGAFLALAVIAVALGAYEYVTGQVLWNRGLLDTASLSDVVRVNSLFFDPNIYGRFLMVVLLGLLAALAWGAQGRRVAALAAIAVALWLGLLVSYSQSSMLGLVVGTLVLIGVRFGVRPAILATGGLALAAIVAVVALAGVLRLDLTSSEGLDRSTAGRWALVKGGVDLYAERPVFGWGSGSYRRAYRRETGTSDVRAVAASHTIPLTVAAEQGTIGLALYLGLLITSLLALLRAARRGLASAAIAAAYVAMVLHSWFYAAFLEDPLTWALLAVGLSLAAVPSRAGASTEPPEPAPAPETA